MITIIGGSGFLGTRICQSLEDESIDFEIIDLKLSKRFPEKSKIADIQNLSALRDAITGSTIIHLAAVHRDDINDKNLYYKVNVDGTANICTVADEKNIKNIIFTSSVAVYGFSDANSDEKAPINPFNDYGKSKYKAEIVLTKWQKNTNKKLTIVRPTVIFGEGNRGNVFNLINQINKRLFVKIGSGKNKKSIAYVGNISQFILSFLDDCDHFSVHNYVDKPDYDMNSLIMLIQHFLFKKKIMNINVPFYVGLFFGYVADVVSIFKKNKLPLSSIRVKKFNANTTFKSNTSHNKIFSPPYTIKEGIFRTIQYDFINYNPDNETFETE